jgi:8-oxo-dGTP diphosphatase
MNNLIQLAGCILTNHTGEVLLLHRNTPHLVQWELPGGKLEPGETPEQTAIREAREEIGVTVRVMAHLGDTTFEDQGKQWAYRWFKAEITRGMPRPCEPEIHDDLHYFDLLKPGMQGGSFSANIRALASALQNQQVQL